MDKKILAVIPARGGSKGMPRKNIRDLNGKPLIAYTIEAANGCSLFTKVIVSTDDTEIKEIAEKFEADVPFIRPEELATDKALAVPTIKHALLEVEKLEDTKYDYVFMLQPTTPLRSSEDLTNAINKIIETDSDGIISVVDVDNWHPMKMKKFVDQNLYDYEPPPTENPPRQSLPKVYMVNGALYGCKRDVLVEKNSFKGDKCAGYIMPVERSVNIDGEADFVLAEYYIKSRTK